MIPIQIAFWMFAGLTVVFALLFALALILRLLPSVTRGSKTEFAAHANALTTLAPVGDDAQAIKVIAEALGTALKALGDFGSKLDTLGPTALLGVFTVIFALFTVACAWIAR